MEKCFDIRTDEISMNDSYWTPILLSQKNTLLLYWSKLTEWGVIDNFSVGDPFFGKKHNRRPNADSLLYQWIEAASSLLHFLKNDPDSFFEYNLLQNHLQTAIQLICKVQLSEGYLDTYTQFALKKKHLPPTALTKDEADNLAALLHAGISHFTATQSRELISAAQKAARFLIFSDLNLHSLCPSALLALASALIALYDITDNEHYLLFAFRLYGKSRSFSATLCSRSSSTEAAMLSQTACLALFARLQKAGLTPEKDFSRQAQTILDSFHSFVLQFVTPLGTLNETLNRNRTPRLAAAAGHHRPGISSSLSAAFLLPLLHERFRLTLDPVNADLIEWIYTNALSATFGSDGQQVALFQNPWPAPDDSAHRPHSFSSFSRLAPLRSARLLSDLPSFCFHEATNELFLLQWVQNEIYIPRTGTFIQLFSNLPDKTDVSVRIVTQTPRRFKLHLRIPSWVEGYSLYVNGKKNDLPEMIPPQLKSEWEPHWFDASFLTLDMDEAIESKSIQIHFTESIRTLEGPQTAASKAKGSRLNERLVFRNGLLFYFEPAVNPGLPADGFAVDLNRPFVPVSFKEQFPDLACLQRREGSCLLATTDTGKTAVLLPWAVQADFPDGEKRIFLPTTGGIGTTHTVE